jgi:hypothetical protein
MHAGPSSRHGSRVYVHAKIGVDPIAPAGICGQSVVLMARNRSRGKRFIPIRFQRTIEAHKGGRPSPDKNECSMKGNPGEAGTFVQRASPCTEDSQCASQLIAKISFWKFAADCISSLNKHVSKSTEVHDVYVE